MADDTQSLGGWASYPDPTIRQTYPPLPRTGGDPNKQASDAVAASVVSMHTRSVQQEAEFRARQRMRRLQTRGLAAMRDPEEVTAQLSPDLEVPDDPALEEYKKAGWL